VRFAAFLEVFCYPMAVIAPLSWWWGLLYLCDVIPISLSGRGYYYSCV
jgi:hypothetical protein